MAPPGRGGAEQKPQKVHGQPLRQGTLGIPQSEGAGAARARRARTTQVCGSRGPGHSRAAGWALHPELRAPGRERAGDASERAAVPGPRGSGHGHRNSPGLRASARGTLKPPPSRPLGRDRLAHASGIGTGTRFRVEAGPHTEDADARGAGAWEVTLATVGQGGAGGQIPCQGAAVGTGAGVSRLRPRPG